MKDWNPIKLKITYSYLMFLYLVQGYWWRWITSEIRALWLFTALVAIVAVHLAIARSIKARNSNRPFFLLALLWCVQLAIFFAEESLSLLWGEGPIFISFLNLILLTALMIVTAVSFVLRKPFWYVEEGGKGNILAGCMLLVISSWLAITTAFTIFDHIRLK